MGRSRMQGDQIPLFFCMSWPAAVFIRFCQTALPPSQRSAKCPAARHCALRTPHQRSASQRQKLPDQRVIDPLGPRPTFSCLLLEGFKNTLACVDPMPLPSSPPPPAVPTLFGVVAHPADVLRLIEQKLAVWLSLSFLSPTAHRLSDRGPEGTVGTSFHCSAVDSSGLFGRWRPLSIIQGTIGGCGTSQCRGFVPR